MTKELTDAQKRLLDEWVSAQKIALANAKHAKEPDFHVEESELKEKEIVEANNQIVQTVAERIKENPGPFFSGNDAEDKAKFDDCIVKAKEHLRWKCFGSAEHDFFKVVKQMESMDIEWKKAALREAAAKAVSPLTLHQQDQVEHWSSIRKIAIRNWCRDQKYRNQEVNKIAEIDDKIVGVFRRKMDENPTLFFSNNPDKDRKKFLGYVNEVWSRAEKARPGASRDILASDVEELAEKMAAKIGERRGVRAFFAAPFKGIGSKARKAFGSDSRIASVAQFIADGVGGRGASKKRRGQREGFDGVEMQPVVPSTPSLRSRQSGQANPKSFF